MTTKTIGGVNTVTKFFNDQNGNITRQRIDANTVEFTYDNRNQMISADDPKGIRAGAACTVTNT